MTVAMTRSKSREMRRCQPTVERTFASLDPLSWAPYRLRRFWKVDCEGSTAEMARKVLKAVRRLREGIAPPRSFLPN